MDVYKECLFAKDPIKIATLMLRAKWNNHYNEILMSGKYSRVEFREWVKDLKLRLSKRSEGEDNLTFRAFKTELANEKITQTSQKRIELLLVSWKIMLLTS